VNKHEYEYCELTMNNIYMNDYELVNYQIENNNIYDVVSEILDF